MLENQRNRIFEVWKKQGYLSDESSKAVERFKQRLDASLEKSEPPPTIFSVTTEIFFLKSSNELTEYEEEIITNFEKMITGSKDSDRLTDEQMKYFEKIIEIQSSYFYKN